MEETLALIPFLPFIFFSASSRPCKQVCTTCLLPVIVLFPTPQTCLLQITCHLTSALPVLASIVHPCSSSTPFH